MQNNSTGMLATSVPVGVVPNAPRWPSWKIHTRAPNAAVNDNTLSTKAFSGRITLPVNRNSSTNVIDGDHRQHERQPFGDRHGAVTVDLRNPGQLHRLARGRAHRAQPVELGLGGVGEQRSVAADGQKRAAVFQSRRGRGRPGRAHR